MPTPPFVVDFSRRQRAMKCGTLELCTVHTAELERLQNLLHFPEEVAMSLTETEFELFNSVPATYYVRHVTLDLSRTVLATRKPNVQDLIQRFHEVGPLLHQCYISVTSVLHQCYISVTTVLHQLLHQLLHQCYLHVYIIVTPLLHQHYIMLTSVLQQDYIMFMQVLHYF